VLVDFWPNGAALQNAGTDLWMSWPADYSGKINSPKSTWMITTLGWPIRITNIPTLLLFKGSCGGSNDGGQQQRVYKEKLDQALA